MSTQQVTASRTPFPAGQAGAEPADFAGPRNRRLRNGFAARGEVGDEQADRVRADVDCTDTHT